MMLVESLDKIDNDFSSVAVIDKINSSKIDGLCQKAINSAESLLEEKINKLSIVEIDNLIVGLDKLVSKQLDNIMQSSVFKELESSWMSIWSLLESSPENIVLSVMDGDKSALINDFNQYDDYKESCLYKEVYEFEYNMPGGLPYSFIVSDHFYENNRADVALLKNIAKVCASSHCPFISSINSEYLGLESFDDIYKIDSLADYLEQPEFYEIRSLRAIPESKYLAMTMPKYILRKPYGNLNPTVGFHYVETIIDDSSYSWASSAFLLARNIIKSHVNSNGIVQVQGPGAGGMVTDLPSMGLLPASSNNIFRTASELMISETTEKRLSDAGLICFSLFKGNDKGCFFSTSSVHKPNHYSDTETMANAKINSHLSYVLLMSRIAHFLKIIHRESIGNVTTKTGLSIELNKWLSALVTKMPDPDAELTKQRPLKDARIIVKDVESDPGNFDIDIFVVPHFQLEGVDIKLSLVSKLPKENS